MTHTGSGRKVEFTPDSVSIYDMQTNLKIASGKVNDQSRLYIFSNFVPQTPVRPSVVEHQDQISAKKWRSMSDIFDDPASIPLFEGNPQALLTMEPSMPMHAYIMHGFDPQNYAEANGHPEWEAAMDEEYNSLIENETWDLVPFDEEEGAAKAYDRATLKFRGRDAITNFSPARDERFVKDAGEALNLLSRDSRDNCRLMMSTELEHNHSNLIEWLISRRKHCSYRRQDQSKAMDREPEDIRFLGIVGITEEAFKILRSCAKLLEWLALSLVLPLSFAILWGRLVIRYVLSHWNAMPTLMETTSPAGQGITKERAELLILMAVYAIFVLGFSLMSAASAVYTMASIYASKEISYACVMSIVVRAWKRLALIFLAFFVLVFFQFACTVVFFNMDLAVYEFGEYVITAFVVCGYLSLGMVRYLACVSTMPEDKSGVRPIRKSRDLNDVATAVSRLGKKCQEPALQGFEHVYNDLLRGNIDARDLEFLIKDMVQENPSFIRFNSISGSIESIGSLLFDEESSEIHTAAAENGSSCPSSDTFPWIEGNDSPAAAAQVVDRDQRGRDFETRGSQSDAKDLQARLQDPHFLYDASSGRDGKKFVMVVAGLSILSVIGAWCSFLTLLYMGFMVSLTLPALYHKYEDKIDRFVDRASVEVKRPYVHISDKVTVAKKKLYIWFDDRVLRKILWRRVKPE